MAPSFAHSFEPCHLGRRVGGTPNVMQGVGLGFFFFFRFWELNLGLLA